MLTVRISQREALFLTQKHTHTHTHTHTLTHTHTYTHTKTNRWWVNQPLRSLSYQQCVFLERPKAIASQQRWLHSRRTNTGMKDNLLRSIDCIVIGDWSKGGWAVINGHPGTLLAAVACLQTISGGRYELIGFRSPRDEKQLGEELEALNKEERGVHILLAIFIVMLVFCFLDIAYHSVKYNSQKVTISLIDHAL